MRHPGKDLPRRPRRGILDEKPRERPPTEARCGTLHEGPRKRPPTEAPRGSQDLPRRPRCPRQRLAKPGTSQAFQRTRSWGTSPMHTSLASDAAIGRALESLPGGPRALQGEVDRVRTELWHRRQHRQFRAAAAPSATVAPQTPGGPRSSRLVIQASHATGKVHLLHQRLPGVQRAAGCGPALTQPHHSQPSRQTCRSAHGAPRRAPHHRLQGAPVVQTDRPPTHLFPGSPDLRSGGGPFEPLGRVCRRGHPRPRRRLRAHPCVWRLVKGRGGGSCLH